jgi:hypothetical protein
VRRDTIFVSYSHHDAAWLDRLRIFLKPFPWGLSYKEGGRLWADPYIQTGERWRREIGDGLARARVAVLLVSPDFLASDFIREHELPAILEAAAADEVSIVCVPVSSSLVDLARPELVEYQWPRPPGQPLDLLRDGEREAALAQICRKLYEVAQAAGLTEPLPAAGTRERRFGEAPRPAAPPPPLPSGPKGGDVLIAELVLGGAAPAQLFGVPAQRPHHIPRLDVRDRLRSTLLTGPRDAVGITGAEPEGVAGRVGLFGQGGLGKTVAAIDLVHDEAVRRAFPDGIHWLTLGQNPDLAGLQSGLIRRLTGRAGGGRLGGLRQRPAARPPRRPRLPPGARRRLAHRARPRLRGARRVLPDAPHHP